jgi:hypothetical protein
MEILGHSSITTTTDTYAHGFPRPSVTQRRSSTRSFQTGMQLTRLTRLTRLTMRARRRLSRTGGFGYIVGYMLIKGRN